MEQGQVAKGVAVGSTISILIFTLLALLYDPNTDVSVAGYILVFVLTLLFIAVPLLFFKSGNAVARIIAYTLFGFGVIMLLLRVFLIIFAVPHTIEQAQLEQIGNPPHCNFATLQREFFYRCLEKENATFAAEMRAGEWSDPDYPFELYIYQPNEAGIVLIPAEPPGGGAWHACKERIIAGDVPLNSTEYFPQSPSLSFQKFGSECRSDWYAEKVGAGAKIGDLFEGVGSAIVSAFYPVPLPGGH